MQKSNRSNGTSKNSRILRLYTWLSQGKCVNTIQMANEFEVDARTIQRDIADIRSFLADQMLDDSGDYLEIEYDRVNKGYCLKSF